MAQDVTEDERLLEHLLGHHLYKENVQDLLDDLNLPVSGGKEELISRLLSDDDFDPEDALALVEKPSLKEFCEEFDLPTGGSREELVNRVLEAIKADESGRSPKQTSPATIQAANSGTSGPLPQPNPRSGGQESHEGGWIPPFAPSPSKTSGPPSSQPLPTPASDAPAPTVRMSPTQAIPSGVLSVQLSDVLSFLQDFRLTQPYHDEGRYKTALSGAFSARYGSENVREEQTIPSGRIDLELFRQIGIELKYPVSRADLDRLVTQTGRYQSYYRENLVVVIFSGGYNVPDLMACRNHLENMGVRVVVK